MKFKQTPGVGGGPSSAIGIMRFFDTEAGGPKMTPEFVVVVTAIFVVIVLAFHILA